MLSWWQQRRISNNIAWKLRDSVNGNRYVLLPQEYVLHREKNRKVLATYGIYGALGWIATSAFMNRVLRSTKIYRGRHVIGIVVGLGLSRFINGFHNRPYLQKVLRLNDSPLAIEVKNIVQEIEGRNGPWLQANGPELISWEGVRDLDEEGDRDDDDRFRDPYYERERLNSSDHYLGYELVRTKRTDSVPPKIVPLEKDMGVRGLIGGIEGALEATLKQPVDENTARRLREHIGRDQFWDEDLTQPAPKKPAMDGYN